MAKPRLAPRLSPRPRTVRAPKNRYVRLDGVTLKKLSVYFPEDLAIWLGMHAKQLECSVSELVTQLAAQYRSAARDDEHGGSPDGDGAGDQRVG